MIPWSDKYLVSDDSGYLSLIEPDEWSVTFSDQHHDLRIKSMIANPERVITYDDSDASVVIRDQEL